MDELRADLADYSAALIEIAGDLGVDLDDLFSEDVDDITDDPMAHFLVGFATAAAKAMGLDVVEMVEATAVVG